MVSARGRRYIVWPTIRTTEPDHPSFMQTQPLGQRRTRQREVIAAVIREAKGPLTVAEILQRAQTEIPGLGIATVYRTLKLLQDAEQVETVILPTGETRFEAADLGHHHHFHCRACDQVYDLSACPVTVPADRELGRGFLVERHELTLYGLCPACAAAP
jgi:Fur family transcriptional regulator, ferric uptake regulator